MMGSSGRGNLNKPLATIVALGIAVVAIALPIASAIYFADQQGVQAVKDRAASYAVDVLLRSEATADQIDRGIRQLADTPEDKICSDEQIALMRRIDLGSSYLQAIGRVRDNQLQCSSLAVQGVEMQLGPVDLTSARGVRVRENLRLPFIPDTSFLVVERDGYAAIVHKALPIDVGMGSQQGVLATFSTKGNSILTANGPIEPDWMDRNAWGGAEVFVDGEHVVARQYSERYLIGAIATLHVAHAGNAATRAAGILVPIGILAGLALALAVYQLSMSQLALPKLIRHALRRNEFFMVYEPVVDLETGQWAGAEALIRWRRSNGEMMRPDLFIPVAEETGLIAQITARVVQLVARDAPHVVRRLPGFRLGLNLAASDLESRATIGLLSDLARQMQRNGGFLVAEATERGLSNPELAAPVIDALRAAGVRVAIDDFGTGYSSLASLQKFKFDYLKIDKSFIDPIGTGAATSQVVLQIIEMGRALGLEMVAEGVETEAQLRFLKDCGVRYAQGWLYSKPLTIDELLTQLSARS